MRITISGPPGSGTTTVARKLSEKLGYPVISAGEVFRKLARERGMSLEEFSKYAENNPDIDNLIDKRQREEALRYENVVVEGRLSGWMVPADLKVWIYCDKEIRIQRIARREKKPVEVVRNETEVREELEKRRYLKIYGIDIEDRSLYHIMINSARFTADQIAEMILRAVELIYDEKNGS
ncbi:(d)CMP kinase [Geoglobus acetivorans]|uniref:Cytidylate kinase n=1 Tax=Geoglobus acetivorans TaxID=565033 RepID=A0ABZ3GZI2_GEOAI|nr:AAA family ATPase [Geoglobus acetivorans]